MDLEWTSSFSSTPSAALLVVQLDGQQGSPLHPPVLRSVALQLTLPALPHMFNGFLLPPELAAFFCPS